MEAIERLLKAASSSLLLPKVMPKIRVLLTRRYVEVLCADCFTLVRHLDV